MGASANWVRTDLNSEILNREPRATLIEGPSLHPQGGGYSVPNLGCFWHPQKEYVPERSLDDRCPDCGRTYGAPLVHPPAAIRDYTVITSIDRGFYGAIYLAERGPLRRRSVLKVIPRGTYELFQKDFLAECRTHNEVAEGTRHLVEIQDAFDDEVLFGGETEPIPCHVAVLAHVAGETLEHFIARPDRPSAPTVAQVAIDLFRLLGELESKRRFHNDLHARNLIIRRLPDDQQRPQAVDPSILTVAVDLGSITDASRSDEEQQTGDLHQVAHYLRELSQRVLDDPDNTSDLDYRLSSSLNDIAHLLAPETVNQRRPHVNDLVDMVNAAFALASSPWKEPPGGLQTFDESYNAQTLKAWYVPQLLVDPAGWQSRLETAGPQIVTGMRGCGKTMLLRSLQFHARASLAVEQKSDGPVDPIEALRRDGYIGLYVSCVRLLDRLGTPGATLHEPYARLFLAYAREGLRALRHLNELRSPGQPVPPQTHESLGRVVAAYIADAALPESASDFILERKLQDLQLSLEKGDSRHTLMAHPTIAFPQLAEAIIAASPTWEGSRVFFLLDDVSTRHLHESVINDLVSTLLFNHERCAFKITTEAQTLQFVLRSPGLVESARIGRDYKTFDLGAEINSRLRKDSGRGGRAFISDVLAARAAHYHRHPSALSPRELLGDASLESIARTIASTSEAAPDKKSVYHGVSALAAACVGDIGDVISIYETMLSRAGRIESAPIDAAVQSGCFQESCSRGLYNLNRRNGELKDFALGFAEASHRLLIRSSSAAHSKRGPRLRQYSSVYVRVTSGDQAAQLERIRELTDAGVFVLEGGPDVPRTKTRDGDPIIQFILTYRKLLGISSFIGLAKGDRFELSGQSLEEWLANPSRTAEILLRNLEAQPSEARSGVRADPGSTRSSDAIALETRSSTLRLGRRRIREAPSLTLFDLAGEQELDIAVVGRARPSPRRVPLVQEKTIEELRLLDLESVILGRGFEERTLASTERLLDSGPYREGVLVSYRLDGLGPSVEKVARAATEHLTCIDDASAVREGLTLPPGITLVDVTGLSKPLIFRAVRGLLRRDGRVAVAHTTAAEHYPLNGDIRRVLDANSRGDAYALLSSLSGILTGELGPYGFQKLLTVSVDESRRRALLAPASPKHERLMSLIEERDYDRVDVIAPRAGTPRAELAYLTAQVVVSDFHSSSIVRCGTSDLAGVLELIEDYHWKYYSGESFEIEMALTGSKMHAVACAAASTALRFAQCWYVSPREYDPDRFTKGVGETRYFLLESRQHHYGATGANPALA